LRLLEEGPGKVFWQLDRNRFGTNDAGHGADFAQGKQRAQTRDVYQEQRSASKHKGSLPQTSHPVPRSRSRSGDSRGSECCSRVFQDLSLLAPPYSDLSPTHYDETDLFQPRIKPYSHQPSYDSSQGKFRRSQTPDSLESESGPIFLRGVDRSPGSRYSTTGPLLEDRAPSADTSEQSFGVGTYRAATQRDQSGTSRMDVGKHKRLKNKNSGGSLWPGLFRSRAAGQSSNVPLPDSAILGGQQWSQAGSARQGYATGARPSTGRSRPETSDRPKDSREEKSKQKESHKWYRRRK